MSKGKKFDAAEKHFMKKEEEYQRKIRNLKDIVSQLQIDVSRLTAENNILLTENESLKDWVKRLLSYTELSKEDIRAACEHDKNRNEALHCFTTLLGRYM